ncbi:MAG: alpha-glucosidase, partial [Actinomycetota bacterium]|nr:alpha-glucosidase [Actinomycetota bacterium]
NAGGAALLVEEPHHDGSPLYLPAPPTRLGEEFDVYLRVPHQARVTRVVARQVHDGEGFPAPAVVARVDAGATWWRARLTQVNPVVSYRFLTDAGTHNYRWITAAGPVDHDPTDAGDFKSSLDPGGPDWLESAIAYQIFPDRFARSGRIDPALTSAAADDWAQPAHWGDAPKWSGQGASGQLYGGDLYGVREHLDHIASLGANLLYLTPVFPAPSVHRYNATTFDVVDPLLGGDAAFVELIAEAHRRGMKVIGDFTSNHTGSRHEWFQRAQADLSSPEASYYFFGDDPHDYVGWFGVPSLPKVNHASASLRERMIAGSASPVRRYLRPPYNLDGWRIDVANMTGREGSDDLNAEVARELRAAVRTERSDAYLVGEHFHDFTGDLPGDGWQGVMNYSGFSKPIWTWLARPDLPIDHWLGLPWPGWPRLPGAAVVASMRAFSAIPWPARQASLSLVSSHDTPRIATLTGDPRLVEVAVAAMMTQPGVPMIWAGDELGLGGINGEDARRAMPWDTPATWHSGTLAAYRALAAVRAGCDALRSGGLRWAYTDANRVAFLRETPAESVLVLLARGPGEPIALPSSAIGVHDGADSDMLYGNAPALVRDGSVRLPGDGPGVWIWRWRRSALMTTSGG